MQTKKALSMPPNRSSPEPWHLDKRVPIALIVTIVAQTVAVVWWASGVDHRVAAVESSLLMHATRMNGIETAGRAELAGLRTEIQTRYDRMAETQRLLSEQIIEQRSDVKAIRATLERLERQMDQRRGESNHR